MCTAFGASDIQILKGTQFPLFLALDFWFRIRVGDIPAASSKVNVWNVSVFMTQLLNKVQQENSSFYSNWKNHQMLLNCKSLDMNRQRITNILYCCFSTNLYIQSLHLEQTRNFQSFFAQHHKVFESVDKKVNFIKFWLKGSIFEPIVNKLWLFRLGGTYQWYKDAIFVEINLFIVLVRVKCILLHCTEFPTKQWIRHKFLKDEYSKSNQNYSTKWQKSGTKTQIKIWNRFAQTGPRFSVLIVVVQDNFT